MTEDIHIPADYPNDGSDEQKQRYAQHLYQNFASVKARHMELALPVCRRNRSKKRIFLFTDIGDDIDDFAAMALLLNTPPDRGEISHIVTSGHGHHRMRAKLAEKLAHAGRSIHP